jgi:hypothetical protein
MERRLRILVAWLCRLSPITPADPPVHDRNALAIIWERTRIRRIDGPEQVRAGQNVRFRLTHLVGLVFLSKTVRGIADFGASPGRVSGIVAPCHGEDIIVVLVFAEDLRRIVVRGHESSLLVLICGAACGQVRASLRE